MKKVLLAVVLAGVSCAAAGKAWLIVNEDNDHYFKNPTDLMTEAALKEYVDHTCQGAVTHFFMCPSGQRASFDSKTWEPIWKGIDEPDQNGAVSNIWCVNALALKKKGIDPYKVWIGRCRERGVSPWMSLRMNDVHWITQTNYFRNTTFARTRRDLWINPDGQGWTDRSLDYAKEEVQEYMFRHLAEVMERYDADGLELDWMRFGRNLRPGRERADAHRLDAFMRRTRAFLDALGAKRGRRILLGVRTCRDPDLARDRMGMNVEEWARAGLVDLVVPHSFYRVDAGLNVSGWIARVRAANPRVRVAPGIDQVYRDGEATKFMTLPMYRYVADVFHKAGAEDLYLFNLPYLGKYQTAGRQSPDDVAGAIYAEGLSRDAIAGKEMCPVPVFHDFP